MLKVWGRKNSSNVQKVMWAIGELGLAYERIDLGLEFGGNDTPAYLAMNPTGLVPTLIDGDFILWESNSIVRYLANRYGQGTLEPADPKTRALANQWMDWQMSTFLPAFWDVFHGLVRTPPEKRNHVAIAEAKAGCRVGKNLRCRIGAPCLCRGRCLLYGRYPDGHPHVPLPATHSRSAGIATHGTMVCGDRETPGIS